jgi:hypothetical protein
MLQLRFPTAAETQHDDDKLAYAAATTSYDCPPLLLQAPTLQTMPQPNQLQRRNIQATKPPPATKHWAVMSLRQPIPLYNMRSHSSSRLLNILRSTRNEQKVMLVMTVSAGGVSRVDNNSAYGNWRSPFIPMMKARLPTLSRS